MARATLKFDTSPFEDLIEKLDKAGGNVKEAVTDALEQAAETIEDDTREAVKESNLPAKGKYSKGKTEKSIIERSRVEWVGSTASVSVGFDYGKQGAGGLLITGTPKMKPDRQLNKIYKQKKYMKQINEDIADVLTDYVDNALGG